MDKPKFSNTVLGSRSYEDVYEIIASLGMNMIVLVGFILDYKSKK